MYIYFIVILFTTLLGWIYQHVKNDQRIYIYLFMVLIPSLMAGFRTVGTDYLGYASRFDRLSQGESYLDIGLSGAFHWGMKSVQLLGGNYQLFVFIVSTITIAIAFFLICSYQNIINVPMAVFSYMTFFYLLSFNIYRQILSSEVLLLALYFLAEKKKNLRFWILAILAASIHSSMILYFPVYFFIRTIQERNKRKQRMFFYVALLVLVIIMPVISQILIRFSVYFPHYAYYFLHFRYMGIGLGILRYIILIWACIVAVIRYEKIIEIPKPMRVYIFWVMIGSISVLTSYVSDTYLYRVGYTGLIATPLIHGYFVRNIGKRNRVIITLGLCATLIFFCWYDFGYTQSGDLIPYSSIFNT